VGNARGIHESDRAPPASPWPNTFRATASRHRGQRQSSVRSLIQVS
jgi:hypothetical protein